MSVIILFKNLPVCQHYQGMKKILRLTLHVRFPVVLSPAPTHVLPSAHALLHPGQTWMFQQDNGPWRTSRVTVRPLLSGHVLLLGPNIIIIIITQLLLRTTNSMHLKYMIGCWTCMCHDTCFHIKAKRCVDCMDVIKSKESFWKVFEWCVHAVNKLEYRTWQKDFGESRPMMGFLFTLSARHEKTCVQMY